MVRGEKVSPHKLNLRERVIGIKKFKKYGSDNITNKDFEELNAKFKSLEKDNARMYAQNNFLKLEIKKLEKQISEKGLIKKPVKSLRERLI